MRTTGTPSSGPDSYTCMPRRSVSTRKERIARDYCAMTRVVLSTPGPDDEDEFLAANHTDVKFHRPWAYNPMTSEAYRAYLAALGERKVGFFARRVAGRELVGWINLSEIVRG